MEHPDKPETQRIIVLPSLPRKAVADPDATLVTVDKRGVVRRYKPTQKQLKAEYYRSKGMSKQGAMRKAGYKMGHTGTDLAFTPKFQMYLNATMQHQLRKKGLSEEKIAEKMMGWLDAKKTHVTKDGDVIESEDTLAQIKGYQEIDKIIRISGDSPVQGKKRKMTIEEWTFGDEE